MAAAQGAAQLSVVALLCIFSSPLSLCHFELVLHRRHPFPSPARHFSPTPAFVSLSPLLRTPRYTYHKAFICEKTSRRKRVALKAVFIPHHASCCSLLHSIPTLRTCQREESVAKKKGCEKGRQRHSSLTSVHSNAWGRRGCTFTVERQASKPPRQH